MQLLTRQEAGVRENKGRAFIKTKADDNKKPKEHETKMNPGPKSKVATQQQDKVAK